MADLKLILMYDFCLAFLLFYSLFLVYYNFLENARAFLKIFMLMVLHHCGKLPCYFPEQSRLIFIYFIL